MSFTTNDFRQLSFDDSFLKINDRTKKFVMSSWAKGFAEVVFLAINENRFSVLYSDTKTSRPNNPVNVVIGSLILKELFNCQTANYNRVQQQIKIPSDTYQTARSCL